MSTSTALVASVFLLLGNAFFVGAEFAVMSVRRSQVEPLLAAGNRRARTVMYALEHVSEMLATAQLGITVCSTSLGALAEPALAHLIEVPFEALGLPAGATHVVGFALALTLVVYLHVVAGEMIPKNLAISRPERAALVFAPPLVALSRALKPVIWGLNALANSILRLAGVEPKSEVSAAFTAEEVASIVERSQAEGVLRDEVGLLSGALEFSEETAGDVMVPRDRLVTLMVGVTPEDVEREVARTGFSRFPVLDGDQLVGYLHLKDVLYADGGERTSPVAPWRVRALAVVGMDDEVEEALAVMQRSGAHLARVVDHEGETAGVLFLEDILEELVGEVRDAMQRREPR
ncbi:MAG: HlyC/CorC family transporter [Actinomycetales bacterium]|nr:HlyC/CorC family transporter [Actinomycetales bacterium]